MSALTKETARSLAKVLNSGLSTYYSDDLVAILGVGRESNNEEAVQSWLLARFGSEYTIQRAGLLEHASETLQQHLNDVRMEVAVGAKPEFPMQQSFIPPKILTDLELRCVARAIYLLILNDGTKLYLDALIELVLESDGSPIEKITAWISSQTISYTYFPSEMTLPLAQRLMQELKAADGSY